MKKILILMISGILLSGCHSMQKLRVNYSPTGEDYSNYYQDKDGVGHNRNVKYSVINDTLSTIEIPVKYDVKADPIPDKLPEALESSRKLLDKIGECYGNCKLTSETLTLGVSFEKRTSGNCPDENGVILMYIVPFLWPFLPSYINSCTGVDIYPSQEFRIYSPFEKINQESGITVKWSANPDYMELDCDSKSCVARDKNGNIVNQILITKNIKVNTEKIKQVLAEEKKQKAKEEEQNKRWHRIQQEKCVPAIYVLHQANHQYVDLFLQKQATDTFVNYNCDDIAREIFEGR